jgi:hypothetical protein
LIFTDATGIVSTSGSAVTAATVSGCSISAVVVAAGVVAVVACIAAHVAHDRVVNSSEHYTTTGCTLQCVKQANSPHQRELRLVKRHDAEQAIASSDNLCSSIRFVQQCLYCAAMNVIGSTSLSDCVKI